MLGPKAGTPHELFTARAGCEAVKLVCRGEGGARCREFGAGRSVVSRGATV